MNILSVLKKLKTADDFTRALGDLERELAAATAAVDELEGRREE